jgi:Mn-dependent DtxR family transcriptional regulator
MATDYDWSYWPEDEQLLWLIYLLDEKQEGIPETNLTCNDDGIRNSAATLSLQRLAENGYITMSHPYVDITEKGIDAMEKGWKHGDH